LPRIPPVYGTMGGMEKTTVYLTSEQKAALAAAARAEGRSEARLIRDGIDGLLSRRHAGETIAPLARDGAPGEGATDASPVRQRWIAREAFVQRIRDAQADPALRQELRDLAPDTTDEVPDR